MLRAHDCCFGSQTTFTAGKFSGVRERQWNKAFKVGGVDTYVWEYKTETYLIEHRFTNSGAVEYPGFVPRSVIALRTRRCRARRNRCRPRPRPRREAHPDHLRRPQRVAREFAQGEEPGEELPRRHLAQARPFPVSTSRGTRQSMSARR